MNSLSIDDIHRARREHEIWTQSMSFDEFKADLHKEIEPLLGLLKSMKVKQKKIIAFSMEIESTAVAEPETTYHT